MSIIKGGKKKSKSKRNSLLKLTLLNKLKKSKQKKKTKGKCEMDEYYISAKIAVDCASALIALILDMFEPGRRDLYVSDSNYTQLVTSSFLTLCELAKPTTYFSNKIDGQTIDIKNLTDSFNISVNGLIMEALDSEIFDKVVLQKEHLSNSLVDAILKFIDIGTMAASKARYGVSSENRCEPSNNCSSPKISSFKS